MDLRDWIVDRGGNPLSGLTVRYRAASNSVPNVGAVIDSTTTDSNGMFEFTGVTPGAYDVEAINDAEMILWKASIAMPMSFGDGQVATDAGILLSKLAAGTANEGVTPDGTAANFDDRLNDIVSQLKAMLGLTHWYSAPSTTLLAAFGHSTASGNVHSLLSGDSFLGVDGSGQTIRFGHVTTGTESALSPGFVASAIATFAHAFPTACDEVIATFDSGGANGAWATCSSKSASSVQLEAWSTVTGKVANKTIRYIAIGH